MEDLQTDTLTDYGKNKNQPSDSNRDNENACAGNLLNGCEEIEDSLDLMDNCENTSIGSNSDVWKGSDSEDDNPDGKENSQTDKSLEKAKPPDTSKNANEDTGKEDCEMIEIPSLEENDKTDPKLPASENNGDASEPSIEEAIAVESEKQNEAEDSNKIEKNLEKEAENVADQDGSKNNEEPEPAQMLNGDDASDSLQDKDTDAAEKDAVTEDPVCIEITEGEDMEKTLSNGDATEKPSSSGDATEKPSSSGDGAEKASSGDATEKPSSSGDATEKASSSADTTEKASSSADATDMASASGDAGDADLVVVEDKDPLADDALDKDVVEGRHPNRYNEGVEDESQMDYDAEDDDDFDPSLLCPEVSMAVDENAVVSNGPAANETGTDSPVLYDTSFSTFVDEVTGAEISFNLTPEEQELRKRLYGPTNAVQFTRLHCTACNLHLGSALETQSNRFVHPLLKVLICKKCYHFYTSGDFDKDEDGSELYCRWCGQGGQVLCCSKCEYVFCKRCIRTNFGRKKMFEIRDSDSWDCFRCNPAQIITQRIACFEFFEYVRRELSRPFINTTEMWSKDNSRCCNAKKRALENGEQEVKKPKKKKGERDPDYNPLVEKPVVVSNSPPSLTPGTLTPSTSAASGLVFVAPKAVQLMSRFTLNTPKDNDIEFVRQIPAPQVTLNAAVRPTFRTILPTHIRPAFPSPTLVRISSQPVPPLVPTGTRILGSALQGRNVSNSNLMKHEWFEKTVRAAARVNSHLSYTLTQLNKAQSQAASVEELAVVHNKLQEILSSSINSLIQIRKNLRTEFIAGIKTVRLPSKKTETFNNDDDVIFVSAPTTMPMPTTSQFRAPPKDPLIIIDNSNSVAPVTSTIPKPTTSTEWPKGYLKVKSVKDLQNVPSECITIPDDAPPPKPTEDASKSGPSTEVVCNGVSNATDSPIKTSTPLVQTPAPKAATITTDATPKTKTAETVTVVLDKLDKSPVAEKTEGKGKRKSDVTAKVAEGVKEPRTRRSKLEPRNSSAMYDVTNEPTHDIKRMMNVKVNVPRVDLEELQKRLASGSQ